MENETREVTYLALSLMMIALVIGFISYGLGITRRVSAERNTEIAANEKIEQYRKFNAYDCKTLFGDDVVELIRMYYDSTVVIYADYRENVSTGDKVGLEFTNTAANQVSHGLTCSNCVAPIEQDHRYFSSTTYINHVNTLDDYISLDINNTGEDRDDLRNWFPTDSKYRAYLVYNNEDIENYYWQLINSYVTNKNVLDTETALDKGKHSVNPSSEVTGIILINLKNVENREILH